MTGDLLSGRGDLFVSSVGFLGICDPGHNLCILHMDLASRRAKCCAHGSQLISV